MASLINAQWEFLKNLSELIQFIESKGHIATGGELQRTIYQQKEYLRTGRTQTINSLHLSKMAIDLAIFKDNIWLQDRESLQQFGNFWESLHPDNEWGGNWKSFIDLPHFQRRLPKEG